MYDYDYERKKRKVEPKIELNAMDKAIEFVLVVMCGSALFFFFMKVMFF